MARDHKYGQVVLGNKLLADDEPVFVIRGKDKLAPQIVEAYARAAEHRGCEEDFVHDVEVARTRIEEWQAAHPDLVKLPD